MLKPKTNKHKLVVFPRPDDKYRTPVEWMQFFKSIGVDMISAPNVHTVWQQDSEDYLTMLRKDFKDRWLNTSSQLEFSTTDMSLTIVHNAGSRKEKRLRLDKVPCYNDVKIEKVLSTDEGLRFINAVFDTKYDPEEMIQFLEGLSERKSSKIVVWTPSQDYRKDHPIRSVDFIYNGFSVRFGLGCYYWDDGGYSHGVSSSGRGPKAPKIRLGAFSEEEIRNDCKDNSIRAIAMMIYNDRFKKRR
jgi:hypothetical protein